MTIHDKKQSNINKFLSNNQNTNEGNCIISTNWVLNGYLNGQVFYSNLFFNGKGSPSESDYVTELNSLSMSPELSATTTTWINNEYKIIDDYSDCNNTLFGAFLKIEVCLDSTFDCVNTVIAPNANITTIGGGFTCAAGR